jgi:hypothetical protein
MTEEKKPLLIQTDDIGTTREMTDQEIADYEALIADTPALPSAE